MRMHESEKNRKLVRMMPKKMLKKHDKFSTQPLTTKQIMTHFTKIDRIGEIGWTIDEMECVL